MRILKYKDFIFRRLHSLTGIWFSFFLLEHLFINSLAPVWFGKDNLFVKFANMLQSLPFLRVVEVVLLLIPFGIHVFWGILYSLKGNLHFFKKHGENAVFYYRRHIAYIFQKITAWIILIFLCIHVVEFRFINYPKKVQMQNEMYYLVKIKSSPITVTLTHKLDGKIYGKEGFRSLDLINDHLIKNSIDLKSNEVLAAMHSPGAAMRVLLNDLFTSNFFKIFYLIFIISVAFHGANGMFSFLISWGVIVKRSYMTFAEILSFWMMFIFISLGLVAIWGSVIGG